MREFRRDVTTVKAWACVDEKVVVKLTFDSVVR